MLLVFKLYKMTSSAKPVEWQMKVLVTLMTVLKLYKIITAIIKELKSSSYKGYAGEYRV